MFLKESYFKLWDLKSYFHKLFQVRTQESKGLPPQISTEDFVPRFEEFRRFEDSFADCLSKTAVKTKFAQHTSRGEQVQLCYLFKLLNSEWSRELRNFDSETIFAFLSVLFLCRKIIADSFKSLQIMRDVSETLVHVHSSSVGQSEVFLLSKKEMWDRCDFVSKQLELITLDMKEKIRYQLTQLKMAITFHIQNSNVMKSISNETVISLSPYLRLWVWILCLLYIKNCQVNHRRCRIQGWESNEWGDSSSLRFGK